MSGRRLALRLGRLLASPRPPLPLLGAAYSVPVNNVRIVRTVTPAMCVSHRMFAAGASPTDPLQQRWDRLMEKDQQLTVHIKALQDGANQMLRRVEAERAAGRKSDFYEQAYAGMLQQIQTVAEERKIVAEKMEAPVTIVPEIAKLLISERRTGAVANAKLEEDEELTAWLQAVNTATERTPVKLEGGLEVVNLDVSYDPFSRKHIDAATEPGSTNAIFIRDCYPLLFDALWVSDRAVLIGNPGTGKSRLQAYVIYRLLKDPKARGKIKCVIRQVAPGKCYVFLLEELKVYTSTTNSVCVVSFLKAFKPDECLYLFEPGVDTITSPNLVGMKTLATVSPLRRRIRKFLEAPTARSFYMPLWTEAELVALAGHLRDQRPADRELQGLYAEAAVRERFAKYGGIYRYVLPTNSAAIFDNKKNFHAGVSTVNRMVFSREGLDVDENVSDFHMQYDVDHTTFRSFTLKLPGEETRLALEQAFSEASFADLKHVLHECGLGILPERARAALEIIAPMMWNRGIRWRRVGGDSTITLPERLETKSVHINDLPQSWKDLTPHILYVVGKVNLEFTEGFYHSDNGLAPYQCKAGADPQLPDALLAYKLRKRLGMSAGDKMHVWYITLPRYAEAWLAKLTGKDGKMLWDEPKTRAKTPIAKEIIAQYPTIIANTTFTVLTYDF